MEDALINDAVPPMKPEVALELLTVLLAVLKQSPTLSPPEAQQLEDVLTTLAMVQFVSRERVPATPTTPYRQRQQDAAQLALERAAETVCENRHPFPDKVGHYLLAHAADPGEAAGEAVAPAGLKRRGVQPALQTLLEAADEVGATVPYHPRFPARFGADVAAKPLFEVEPYLLEFCQHTGLILPQDYIYLADVLAEAQTMHPDRSNALLRGIGWLQQQAENAREAIPIVSSLRWGGRKVDLLEVAYALVEARLLTSPDARVSADQLAAAFARLFGLDVLNPRNHLAQRRLADKSPHPTLDKLLAAYRAALQARDGAPPQKRVRKSM